MQILSSLNENESLRLEILPEAHAHLRVTPLRFRALSFSPPQCELTNTLRRSSITGLLSSFLLLCREYHVFRCHCQTSICEKSSSFIYPTGDCQQHHSNFVKCYEIWGGTAVLGIGSVDWCTERKHSNVAVFTPESLQGIENSSKGIHWCDFVNFFESAKFVSDNVTKITNYKYRGKN